MTLDLHQLKRERGGAVYDGGRRWVGPGPGHSRRDASLSVALTNEGRALVHSFAGDPFDACADYLGLDQAAPASREDLSRLRTAREAERRRHAAETAAFCAQAWSGVQPLEGTPAESYLWNRGLILDSADIGFHPTAPRSRRPDAQFHPALVALVRNAKDEPLGLHVTYITPDGRKAFGPRSRLMFGPVAGGAVHIEPIRQGVLAVGEGIETSAAFALLNSVAAWGALSTSGLQSFVIPPGVRKLLIAADSDDNGAGLAAAHALAERARRVCEVEIHPAPEAQDWADVVAAHG